MLLMWCVLAQSAVAQSAVAQSAVAQSAVAQGVTPPLEVGEREVPLQILAIGMQGGGVRRANLIISEPNEWKRVWDVYASTLQFKPPQPAIDFKKQSVIAVFLGEQLAADRAVRIVRIAQSAKAMTVHYLVSQGTTKDASGMTVSQTTQPFHFAVIDKPTVPVRFAMTADSARENVATSSTALATTGDAGGLKTGRMSDMATASSLVSRDQLIAVSKAQREGLRALADSAGQNRVAINFAWVLLCGFFALLLQAGLWMWQSGFVRAKNVVHTFTLNLASLLIGALCFWAIGFALMYGASGAHSGLGGTPTLANDARFSIPLVGSVFSTEGFFVGGNNYDVGVGALFFFGVLALATSLLVPISAMAERWTWRAFWPFALFYSLVLFPLFGHWAWGGGWLSQLGTNLGWGCGFVDFAGGGTIHALGGLCALAGAKVLGARLGKFNLNGTSNTIAGVSVPVAIVGVLVITLGGVAFNSGHTLGASGEGGLRIALVATATLLCAAAGGAGALLYSMLTSRKLRPLLIGHGTLGGVVASSACAAFISPAMAVVVGLAAGLLVCWALSVLELLRIDDVTGAIAVHGGAGLWGLVAVGLFADGTYGAGWNNTVVNGQPVFLVGILNGGSGQLVAQLVGCAVLVLWGFGLSYAFFAIQDRSQRIRCTTDAEKQGLDNAELDFPRDETASTENMRPNQPSVVGAPVRAMRAQ